MQSIVLSIYTNNLLKQQRCPCAICARDRYSCHSCCCFFVPLAFVLLIVGLEFNIVSNCLDLSFRFDVDAIGFIGIGVVLQHGICLLRVARLVPHALFL